MRFYSTVTLLLLAMIWMIGCDGGLIGGRSDEAKAAVSASNMHQFHIAINAFRVEHRAGFGEGDSGPLGYPLQLEDVRPYVGDYDQLIKNPRTGDDPGYEYVPPTEHMANVPLIYELKGGQRDPEGWVLYVDGSISKGVRAKGK